MTIAEYTEKLQRQVKEYAASIGEENSDRVTFIALMISFTLDRIAELQQFTYKYAFRDAAEEIQFFKEFKPVLLSQYFFYKKLFTVTLCDSYMDRSSKKEYYKSVLTQLQIFQRKNAQFHLYCLTGQTHHDSTYFTRNMRLYQGLIDIKFSTRYDVKLARLLGNELLRNELSQRVTKLSLTEKISNIHWTGRKSDAVELLFALQASGSINGGHVDVKVLVAAFEKCFNVSLGNYYDFVKKIRMRKGNQASYLDGLKSNLLLRFKEMDE